MRRREATQVSTREAVTSCRAQGRWGQQSRSQIRPALPASDRKNWSERVQISRLLLQRPGPASPGRYQLRGGGGNCRALMSARVSAGNYFSRYLTPRLHPLHAGLCWPTVLGTWALGGVKVAEVLSAWAGKSGRSCNQRLLLRKVVKCQRSSRHSFQCPFGLQSGSQAQEGKDMPR